MNNKETAEELRDLASKWNVIPKSELLALAEKIDPLGQYKPGVYVNTGGGVMIVSTEEEYQKKTGFPPALRGSVSLIDKNGNARWSTGADLSLWFPDPKEIPCIDKNGKVCPPGFGQPKYKAGDICYVKSADIRICDGKTFRSPAYPDERYTYDQLDIIGLASVNNIVKYFTTCADTLCNIVVEWAKTIK